jgi:5-methylthioribose kinase
MTVPQETELLDPEKVRNLVANLQGVAAGDVSVSRLSGGVSAVVFRVESRVEDLVLKQSLAVLDVPWFWAADPGRSAFEAQALRVYASITPDRVPKVLLCDENLHLILMEAAPADWGNFKTALLTGAAPAGVSEIIGRTLGQWHRRTMEDEQVKEQFAREQALEELRIQPYFTASAQTNGKLAALMAEASTFLRNPGRCLVHGDATPKNVLFSPDGEHAWLLDPEVAHYGQPEFDMALWMSHLLLKMQREGHAASVAGAALRSFIIGYRAEGPNEAIDQDAVGLLVMAVVQARLHGISRVDYIDELNRQRLTDAIARIDRDRAFGLDVLMDLGSEAA